MAIFHLDFKVVKRSEGRSSVAKAAYHARCRITDERTSDTYDYSRRTDLYGHFILAPVNAPEHIVKDSTALWNEVEGVERQQNGQTSRYFDVAIPAELNNDAKKKLVLEYCQKNFVDKGMIADIAFHDLESNNPHAHVMLTLKTIDKNGFGKKERSWNDKKMVFQWREAWSTISNSYLEAAGVAARIYHRSLRSQCAAALAQAETASSNEDKAFWLAKATEANRPPMRRIHRAKWNRPAAQEQRAAEQAIRDEAKQASFEVYKTFKELPLEIIVGVRSFTVFLPHQTEEIVLPDIRSGASGNRVRQPVLVAPVPHTRPRGVKSYRNTSKVSKVTRARSSSVSIADNAVNTILKNPSSQTPNNRAARNAKRKQTTPHQSNLFKRFTALVIDFFKEKFIWGKRLIDTTDLEHDKRIGENYVFDEVAGVYVSRSEHEQRARFNSDDYKPISEEVTRFPSRPKKEQLNINSSIAVTPLPSAEQTRNPKLRMSKSSFYQK